MNKIKLMIEMDEETYKQIQGDSVYDNNNKVIISKSSSAYYALNAIINATPITESDDCVSRSAVLAIAGDSCLDLDSYEDTKEFCDAIKDLSSVIPKRDPNENVKTYYFHTDDYCPKEEMR